MSDVAISCEGLGKQYRIGERERYKALRDTLTDALFAPARRLRTAFRGGAVGAPAAAAGDGTFWALRDVSFEVKHGEVIGVIGRNGAGKSTLLKILSRITKPTEGRVRLNGRVGSLLEVGTGFHPELTGRENIYLNGAILGMRRAEIERKFDEIVAFAEIEKFLDTPVKRYSSGMYVRLAFAVAAHLEPEILIIDEVLAVGDAEFQQKCLGKIGNVAASGRTVIFVSHQMNQIRRLCEKAIWLNYGRLKMIDSASKVIGSYESIAESPAREDVPGETHGTRFLGWKIAQPSQALPNVLTTAESVVISFTLKVGKTIRNGHHVIALYSKSNQLIWGTEIQNVNIDIGQHQMIYKLPTLPLAPSNYFWRVSLFDEKGVVDSWDGRPDLVVATKPATKSKDENAGILNLACEFEIRGNAEHDSQVPPC